MNFSEDISKREDCVRGLFLFLLMPAVFLSGCGGQTVEGRIEDAKGRAVQGIKIELAGTEKSVLSAGDGRFSLASADGKLDIKFSGSASAAWPAACLPGPVTKEGGGNRVDLGVIRLGCVSEKEESGRTVFLSSDGRWRDNGDGTVADLRTKLVWQSADPGVSAAWRRVVRYCEDLSLGGKDDWRLPGRDEMAEAMSAREQKPPLHPFASPRKARYWSATVEEGNPVNAYALYDETGASGYAHNSVPYFVRCVRQGG